MSRLCHTVGFGYPRFYGFVTRTPSLLCQLGSPEINPQYKSINPPPKHPLAPDTKKNDSQFDIIPILLDQFKNRLYIVLTSPRNEGKTRSRTELVSRLMSLGCPCGCNYVVFLNDNDNVKSIG
uniref:DinG protein n=1 Tax=Fopius arisanus TaxID=64838 RepID=A0A0C9Q849_9HYME